MKCQYMKQIKGAEGTRRLCGPTRYLSLYKTHADKIVAETRSWQVVKPSF